MFDFFLNILKNSFSCCDVDVEFEILTEMQCKVRYNNPINSYSEDNPSSLDYFVT